MRALPSFQIPTGPGYALCVLHYLVILPVHLSKNLRIMTYMQYYLIFYEITQLPVAGVQ